MLKCNKMDNNFVLGNSVDIKLTNCDVAEVRADVVVESNGVDEKCNVIRLWGQIKDCNGKPIANALLKLIKVVCLKHSEHYEGIAHTVSDCNGFYQFDLCYCDGSECYKVLVNKAYTGAEQIIDTGTGNCNACENGESSYNPCKPYEPIITQHESCCDRQPCERPIKPSHEHCYESYQCERPIKPSHEHCYESYQCERPIKPSHEHCYENYQCEKTVKPAYNNKQPCGPKYTQSINMPLFGCK